MLTLDFITESVGVYRGLISRSSIKCFLSTGSSKFSFLTGRYFFVEEKGIAVEINRDREGFITEII